MNDQHEATAFLHRTYPELAEGAALPHGPLGRIKLEFARGFAHWEIALPESDVEARRRGKICQRGWAIWYLFGANERGEYLDYYAAHRMTNDTHVRLYEDGSTECLDAICGMRRCSEDPAEDARLEAESLAKARRVEAMLAAKGFGMEGNEPFSVQIQRYQRLEETKGT